MLAVSRRARVDSTLCGLNKLLTTKGSHMSDVYWVLKLSKYTYKCFNREYLTIAGNFLVLRL